MTQVDRCQPFALIEHIAHVGHLARVQILYANDVGQSTYVEEPIGSGNRPCPGKRRVEHHRGDISNIAIPFRIIPRLVQVIGLSRTRVALHVAVEGQRLAILRECSVGRRAREVARTVSAAVKAGVFFVHMVGIVGRAQPTHEAGAAFEHMLGVLRIYLRRAPAAAHIDGRQVRTAIEQIAHRRRVPRVECHQVEGGQARAAVEH